MLALADDSDDDSLKALNYILNAWEEAAESGISPEIMAYAALYAALTDLVGAFGEGAVMKLIRELGPRIEKGEFTVSRRTTQ
ncbi:MAG TPA: hypothetical protein VFZ16_17625 [Hyphomicrobiaceae bacterium]|nr:hypothetical protein [Hyphomicrobiaceae bacterium]